MTSPRSERTRRILLADCDQMYCAVARLVDPEGAGHAMYLIVGGRADSRGVVCSASYEARAFGVRAGMPIARALRLCPGATCVPVPRRACAEKSRQVAAVLREWAPVVEPASIDEFYLDLEGTEALYREPMAASAARIREDVIRRTGLSVSVGGGTNRLIAKLAVERAKPHAGVAAAGVFVVEPGQEQAFVRELPLAAIPGVGPKFGEKLRRFGVVRIADALGVDLKTLESWCGVRTGRWLFERIRGRDPTPVLPRDTAKSVSREETFSHDIADDVTLETQLLRLAVRLGADVRQVHLAGRTITLKLRDFDFKTRSACRTLPEPVDSDRGIHAVALDLLHGLRRDRRVAVRLLGVGLSQFAPEERLAQLPLFEPPAASPSVQTLRDRALSRLVDRINTRYGRDAIQPARLVDDHEEE